ncbi:MAG: methyltransferase domain-containing protein [Candidatus Sericytochromatia bacterium]|nr:methyltransferase domain-containing protein [Candidatus Sericytochromatia bacterium]
MVESRVTEARQAAFWQARYEAEDAPWDLGQPAPALLTWLKTHPGDQRRVLVPGCGRGHDALALAEAGYTVVAVDFAASALDALRQASAAKGLSVSVHEADLFDLDPARVGQFDLWFEHTCFCAIDPAERSRYVAQAARLLSPDGQLIGVFFTHGEAGGPPFDSRPEEIQRLFAQDFVQHELVTTPHSVPKRRGKETWGHFTRRRPDGHHR